jgi:hypothetical protein
LSQHHSFDDSARFDAVFTSLYFATITFFFTHKGRQPCVQPPPSNLEEEVPNIYDPQ